MTVVGRAELTEEQETSLAAATKVVRDFDAETATKHEAHVAQYLKSLSKLYDQSKAKGDIDQAISVKREMDAWSSGAVAAMDFKDAAVPMAVRKNRYDFDEFLKKSAARRAKGRDAVVKESRGLLRLVALAFLENDELEAAARAKELAAGLDEPLSTAPGLAAAPISTPRDASATLASGPKALGLGLYEFNGHYYRDMAHEQLPVAELRTLFKKLGGEMICLETEAEYEFFKKLMSLEMSARQIGLSTQSGTPKWLSGAALTHTMNWHSGHPRPTSATTSGVQGSLRSTRSSGTAGLIESLKDNTQAINWGLPTYIEWSSREAARGGILAVNASIQSLRRDAKRFGDADYLYIKHGAQFHMAVAIANSMGGQLAAPRNEGEAAFMNRLVPTTERRYWIGLMDDEQEGEWVYPHSGASPTYTRWNDGQPDNSAGAEHCVVSLRAENRWNDIGMGGDKIPFIVKWE